MEFLKNIRLKIGMVQLKKKLSASKRKVTYTNIESVRSIGIVWDASATNDFAGLSRFHQKMMERKIDVKILGLYTGTSLPDQYTAIRYLTCFKNNELNFFYIPISAETNSFIKYPFDVLIDINFKKIFPLQYITSLSNSGFKVGIFETATSDTPFDLMIELKKTVDVEVYLKHIVEYLEMINSGTKK